MSNLTVKLLSLHECKFVIPTCQSKSTPYTCNVIFQWSFPIDPSETKRKPQAIKCMKFSLLKIKYYEIGGSISSIPQPIISH